MKSVLITGGSRGIGAAAVERFAEEGWQVTFVYLRSDRAAAELAGRTGARAVKADVSDFEALPAALTGTGVYDVLVNNAGISQQKLFTDITPAEWDRMISVNLTGAYNAARAVLPGMISRKHGRVINISSIWGMIGASCEVHYSAAKAGLIGFTKALAKEVGPSGITVNCVAPGVIDTDMNAELCSEDLLALEDITPIGRVGRSDEIADVIFYLASDAAAFITGQVISPNGGMVI